MGLKSADDVMDDQEMGGEDAPASPAAMPAAALPPTAEQQGVIDAVLRGESVLADSFAGCGKTTMQVMVARAALEQAVGRRKPRRIHYMAFNKAMEMEAKSKFPAGVQVSTTHALALRSELSGRGKPLSRFYTSRLKSPKEIRDRISREMGREVDRVREFFPKEHTAITSILNGLRNYCYSADAEPSALHADREHMLYIKDMVSPEAARSYTQVMGSVMGRVWERMSDPDSDFPVTHDTYLKVWERSGPKIFDLLLFDEAQDANPVMLSVLKQAQQGGRRSCWSATSIRPSISGAGRSTRWRRSRSSRAARSRNPGVSGRTSPTTHRCS